jgi:hypothetical protein
LISVIPAKKDDSMTSAFQRSIIVAALLSTVLRGTSYANPFSLTGVWTLQNMVTIDMTTGKTSKDFGARPKGYVVYAPGGFMSVVINAEGREPIPSDAPNAVELRAKLFTTMTAHAGPYEFANGKLVNHVKVAHDPKMVGHDLIRFIRVIDNNHVESSTPVTDRGGKRIKVVLTWQRAA